MRDRAGLIEGRLVVPVDRVVAGQPVAAAGPPRNQPDQADEVVLARRDLGLCQASQREASRGRAPAWRPSGRRSARFRDRPPPRRLRLDAADRALTGELQRGESDHLREFLQRRLRGQQRVAGKHLGVGRVDGRGGFAYWPRHREAPDLRFRSGRLGPRQQRRLRLRLQHEGEDLGIDEPDDLVESHLGRLRDRQPADIRFRGPHHRVVVELLQHAVRFGDVDTAADARVRGERLRRVDQVLGVGVTRHIPELPNPLPRHLDAQDDVLREAAVGEERDRHRRPAADTAFGLGERPQWIGGGKVAAVVGAGNGHDLKRRALRGRRPHPDHDLLVSDTPLPDGSTTRLRMRAGCRTPGRWCARSGSIPWARPRSPAARRDRPPRRPRLAPPAPRRPGPARGGGCSPPSRGRLGPRDGLPVVTDPGAGLGGNHERLAIAGAVGADK